MTKKPATYSLTDNLDRRLKRYAKSCNPAKTPTAALQSLLADALTWREAGPGVTWWEVDADTQPEDLEPELWPEDVQSQLDRFLTEVADGNIGFRANGAICLTSHPGVEIFGLDWTATLLIARDEIRTITGEDRRPVEFKLTNKGDARLNALRNIANLKEDRS